MCALWQQKYHFKLQYAKFNFSGINKTWYQLTTELVTFVIQKLIFIVSWEFTKGGHGAGLWTTLLDGWTTCCT